MIVKKLRQHRNWTQDQLAQFSGLNVRTIQRIESGNKASLESLKSLAAVFEVEILKLTEEITVIDKQTEQWKAMPCWKRANIWGIKSRQQLIGIEYICAGAGLIFWIGGFFAAKSFPVSGVFLFTAYTMALTVRDLDKQDIW